MKSFGNALIIIGAILIILSLLLSCSDKKMTQDASNFSSYRGQSMHEYQFDLSEQGYTIYSGDRYVGFVSTGQTLDSLMMVDNQ